MLSQCAVVEVKTHVFCWERNVVKNLAGVEIKWYPNYQDAVSDVLRIMPEVFCSPQLLGVSAWFFHKMQWGLKTPKEHRISWSNLKDSLLCQRLGGGKSMFTQAAIEVNYLNFVFEANRDKFWHAFGLLHEASICTVLNRINKCHISCNSKKCIHRIKCIKEPSSGLITILGKLRVLEVTQRS